MAEETTLRRMQADRKEPRGKIGFDEADVAQGKHSSQESLVDQMKLMSPS